MSIKKKMTQSADIASQPATSELQHTSAEKSNAQQDMNMTHNGLDGSGQMVDEPPNGCLSKPSNQQSDPPTNADKNALDTAEIKKEIDSITQKPETSQNEKKYQDYITSPGPTKSSQGGQIEQYDIDYHSVSSSNSESENNQDADQFMKGQDDTSAVQEFSDDAHDHENKEGDKDPNKVENGVQSVQKLENQKVSSNISAKVSNLIKRFMVILGF